MDLPRFEAEVPDLGVVLHLQSLVGRQSRPVQPQRLCWSEAETFGVGSFCVGRRAQYIAVALRATGVGCRRRIRRRSLFVSSADFALVHARGDARLAATHRWQSLNC